MTVEENGAQVTSVRNNTRRSRGVTPKVTDHPLSSNSTTEFMYENKNTYTTSTTNTPTAATTTANEGSKYDWRMHSLLLCRHILTRGLEDGIGSDITVHIPAWNKTYHLHKLILDQNPYFKLLLQGGFRESTQDTVTLHFEDNPFITYDSFQFVLEYLYGKIEESPPITRENVCQILATSSYFHLDMYNVCVDYVLKSLNHLNVMEYLLFADEHMIQGSDRISDAVFTFLCREAFTMERHLLVTLPLDWLQRVVESDAFWVPSEYDRYRFIKEIIHARHDPMQQDIERSIIIDDDLPTLNHILSHSIYYMHMTFEQLEWIEKDKNPFTDQALVPASVLREALWMQVRLRSKIESASESDIHLDLSATHQHDQADKYPIPTDDTTTYTGESALATAVLNNKASSYSIYPPFRFSVEFNNVPLLKHGMRVYSDTVFYAGSNWNMYIQKTKSQRKNVLQLGVYLHRQSIPSSNTTTTTEEDVTLSSSSSSQETAAATDWTFSRFSDKRKIVKTWFKIYCPARGPKHALTLFQSSPDNFTVLQSWGWRSTTLCADEDATLEDSDYTQTYTDDHDADLKTLKNTVATLRFSVVMGHV
ncbi:hypothetical protein K501DRAFT_275218 [Backusella circina FSU 941]|nr:hypothetical protein K501DRAFT_275218 [Backusella circina FSU 941]